MVYSFDFQNELINKPISFKQSNSVVSSKDCFLTIHKYSVFEVIKNYTIGLYGTIKDAIKKNDTDPVVEDKAYTIYSKEHQKLIKAFREKILIEIDEETGIIKVTTSMPDKYSTFELNKLILDQLKDYAVEYRTNKLQNNLEFLESESQKAEEQYNLSEEALAEYADRNLVISTQKSQIVLWILRNKRS